MFISLKVLFRMFGSCSIFYIILMTFDYYNFTTTGYSYLTKKHLGNADDLHVNFADHLTWVLDL